MMTYAQRTYPQNSKLFALTIMLAHLWNFDQEQMIARLHAILMLPASQQGAAYRALIDEMMRVVGEEVAL
jgi:hypothetical protein